MTPVSTFALLNAEIHKCLTQCSQSFSVLEFDFEHYRKL